MEFMQHFFQVNPRPGELLTGCLGQAGFLFGNAAGTVIALDAYLGNAVPPRLDGAGRERTAGREHTAPPFATTDVPSLVFPSTV